MASGRITLVGTAATLAIAALLVFLVLPTVLVVPMAFGDQDHLAFPPRGLTWRWFSAFFSDPEWRAATWFSVKIAVLTTIAATAIGTAASLAFVRGTLPGVSVINALALAPLIVPHIVVAIAMYLELAPLGLTGSTTGFVLAHTVLAVPYVVLTVSAALHRVDGALELAALNLGASRLRAFTEVTLPLIAPGVAAGAAFAFIASFDEATVSFFISGVGNKTLTRKLFEDVDFNLTPVIAAASTVLVVVSLVLMSGAEFLRRMTQRRRRSFPTESRRLT
ncbi:MAG: ABC transporter permease [Alphaproteobacteria bacterium]|nr:ABC transporter permease [Alphaproteobacteria bacterium]